MLLGDFRVASCQAVRRPTFDAIERPLERLSRRIEASDKRHGVEWPGVSPAWAQHEVLRLTALTGAGCRTVANLFNPLHAGRRNARTLLGHLFLAMGRFGKPESIRTDNDAVFKSRVFRRMCALFRIRQQFAVRGCP